MQSFLIKNVKIVNSGRIFYSDLLIKDRFIERIDPEISRIHHQFTEINGEGKTLIPGVIDVHVHFREPGLTYKADIFSESGAAIAGGVTSFIEMPNTNPKTTSVQALKNKFKIAANTSFANYSFYIGSTNDNFDEVIKSSEIDCPGVKIFLGSSTGGMLVDNEAVIEKLFSEFKGIVVIHSEDENIINANLKKYKEQFGEDIPYEYHADIRSAEACFLASRKAIELAKKHNTRLHLAHLSTSEEVTLLSNEIGTKDKRITAEVGPHHLIFDKNDYSKLKGLIKCNPSIKESKHKKALFEALLNGTIDLVATDHAPHTWDEKQGNYMNCPSGIPFIQHSLISMLEFCQDSKISLEDLVYKMSHNPAIAFKIKNRGFIEEGYNADIVLIDTNSSLTVTKDQILYKCGWSPLEGKTFRSRIEKTFVNGNLAFNENRINPEKRAEKLSFEIY